MGAFFNTILYQPLFNILVGLYNLIPGTDIGLAIIALTVLVKAVLYPLMNTSIRAQKNLQELQPKMKELKERYGSNKEELAKRTMELYKTNKINPLSSCLPVLVQLPILLALYWVLRDGLGTADFSELYSFVKNPGTLDPHFFGWVDLAKPNVVLAVLAGIAQFWQAKMLMTKRPPAAAAGTGGKDEDFAAIMNKQMTYVMPIVTLLISLKLPGGLALYWLVSTVLTAVQQLIVFKKVHSVG